MKIYFPVWLAPFILDHMCVKGEISYLICFFNYMAKRFMGEIFPPGRSSLAVRYLT